MIRKLLLAILLSFSFNILSSQSQVRVRLFTGQNPQYLFFKVTKGHYIIDWYSGQTLTLKEGEIAVFSRFRNKIGVKPGNITGFETDSLLISGSGQGASFSLRTSSDLPGWRNYTGSLECFPDLGSLLVINTTAIENYVAGVVKAEGGNGKNQEYFKTQALIARTYTYKYLNKHKADRYNLCNDTHCQVFNGLTTDNQIITAVKLTEGQVIVTSDSSLIISAFHSNCGGETSPSEYAWLTSHAYLSKVVDPFCIASKNAVWYKNISLKEWNKMLALNGYKGPAEPAEIFSSVQRTRMQNYITGTFAIPFAKIRDGLGLRSSWFSVTADGDSVYLAGKGYGHGVGLCQEGAIAMAAAGKKSEEIIKYYYPGVSLMKIEYVKQSEDDNKEQEPSN